MNSIAEYLKTIKDSLNELLTNESSKDTIDKIADISKSLDTVNSEYNKRAQELSEMKSDYIDLVKHTGFKSQDDLGNNDIQPEEISFDDFVGQWLDKNK